MGYEMNLTAKFAKKKAAKNAKKPMALFAKTSALFAVKNSIQVFSHQHKTDHYQYQQ